MRKRALVLSLAVVMAGSSFLTPSMASMSAPPTSTSFANGYRCLAWNVEDWVTRLRGDLDGDHVVDTVTTRARWVGEETCRAVLVARTVRGTTRVAISGYQGHLMKPPGLAGLVRIGPGHHLGIAVVVLLGANTVWLDLYALRRGELYQVNHDILRYGGGIAYLFGTDCVRRHSARMVSTRAVYGQRTNRYRVQRSFYALRAGQLVRLPRLTERYVVAPRRLVQFPELNAGRSFPSCTVVRGWP